MSLCAVVQPTVTMPTRRVQAMNTVHHVVHDASHRSFMSPPDGATNTDELRSRNELLRSVGMSSRNPDEARDLAHKTIKDVLLCTPWHCVSFLFDPVCAYPALATDIPFPFFFSLSAILVAQVSS